MQEKRWEALQQRSLAKNKERKQVDPAAAAMPTQGNVRRWAQAQLMAHHIERSTGAPVQIQAQLNGTEIEYSLFESGKAHAIWRNSPESDALYLNQLRAPLNTLRSQQPRTKRAKSVEIERRPERQAQNALNNAGFHAERRRVWTLMVIIPAVTLILAIIIQIPLWLLGLIFSLPLLTGFALNIVSFLLAFALILKLKRELDDEKSAWQEVQRISAALSKLG